MHLSKGRLIKVRKQSYTKVLSELTIQLCHALGLFPVNPKKALPTTYFTNQRLVYPGSNRYSPSGFKNYNLYVGNAIHFIIPIPLRA